MISPFHIAVSDAQLEDLRRRLRGTRWPERETAPNQGVPLDYMRELCAYWADGYDWRTTEARLNTLPQFRTDIDGLGIHFIHVRSTRTDALPLLMTHGWPGSVVELLKVIGPLSDDFHVVCPSLPGYGFSERPAESGWGVERIAGAWATLMARLGYERYGAQGSDWGTSVSTCLGQQTIGYSLTDSPAGLAAWIVEKLWAWTDCDGHVENVLTRDEILDNLMLYWLPGTGASSARLYWESIRQVNEWISGSVVEPVDVPTGCSVFPKELQRPSRRWAERRFPDIRYWNEPARGGHFAAFEQPSLFVDEVRAAFRQMR